VPAAKPSGGFAMKAALTFLSIFLLVDLLAFSDTAEASWRSTQTSVVNPNAVYCKEGKKRASHISKCPENRKGKQAKRNK
jgi:hypothetical protein